jgi:predicted RNase H-like HicB family nuclease
MRKLRVTIYKGPDDYGVAVDNFEGLFGAGENPSSAIRNLKDGIEIFKKYNDAPEWMKRNDYELITRFDIKSLIAYYKKIFKISTITKYTGISDEKIKAFLQEKSQPTKAEHEKVINGLKRLGVELAGVKFNY